MTAARWEPVDNDTADLLHLVALGPLAPTTADREWQTFLAALETAQDFDGQVRPNRLRPMVRDLIAPQRVGAFMRRALCAGLLRPTGEFEVSDDVGSRNRGKPVRCYVLEAAS